MLIDLQYRNSAGRLLRFFRTVRLLGDNKKSLAESLDFPDPLDFESTLLIVIDVQREFESLKATIESIEPTNLPKYELYTKSLRSIESMVNSFVIHQNAGNKREGQLPKVAATINDPGIVALEFIAADLPQDDEVEPSQLDQLRTLVDQLRGEIESSTEFSKPVRTWLLDLVRMIRDSLDRFSIRGGRAMRHQISQLVGELCVNHAEMKEAKATSPTMWAKLMTALDVMSKIASTARNSAPVLYFTQKALTFLGGEADPTEPPQT